ncbi:hypothetical protein NP233_g302 [Leucocoprinus birnbaumii]|uniref:Peroxidase n=1 Tax=Leucocoprinus birnbaumii TaxID=56174 RepID=A0AAD5W2F5_9AGAR|nr:hypothetical protein NP233_g302 [Leucocoprinus birnbaumii]
MLSSKKSLTLALLFQAPLSFAYQYPSPQYEALETFLYEGQRGDGSNLASLVHPCRKRTGTMSSVAAEWLRFAFHDMATHNVDDGTGGLDGSLVYELERPENFGLGFNQTATDFETFPNKYVSRADIFALGAVFAVATCGGPVIPYRGGRVDVWQAGGFGTPQPHEDLDTLKEEFRKQGFSNTEMITLTACGHSLGGVRDTDFPMLVSPSTTPGVPHIIGFDSTELQYDNKVVTEYLSGTTQNVLVNTPNTTMASDLRVFTSDGNQTMQGLADSNTFMSQCQSLLERMFNTVPQGVTLTDEITLIPAKVSGAQLTIEQGQLVFKSTLRLTQPNDAKLNTNRTVTMFWCDKYGSAANCAGSTKSSSYVNVVQDDTNNSPMTWRMGIYFVHYQFVVPIQGSESISKFWFEVDEHNGTSITAYNNGGSDYPVVQDQILFVPTLSSSYFQSNGTSAPKTKVETSGEAFTKVLNFTVAVRQGSNPSRVYASVFDNAIHLFPFATNTTIDFTRNSSATSVDGYDFYTGSVEDIGLQTTLDLHLDSGSTTYTEDFQQTTFLDNTPYFKPSTVNANAHSVASSSRSSFVLSLPFVVESMLLGSLLLLVPLELL